MDFRAAPSRPAPLREITPIPAIQGSGTSSPLEGKQVATEGVIVAVRTYASRSGEATQTLFIQDPVGDGDLDTSDAIAVRMSSAVTDAKVGQRLVARGTVSERYNTTGLENATVELGSKGAPPPATALALPDDREAAARYLEARENMVASFPDALVLGPTQSYAEFSVVDEAAHGPAKDYDQARLGSHLVVGTRGGPRIEVGTGDRIRGIRGVIEDTKVGHVLQLDAPVEHEPGPGAPKLWGDVNGSGTVTKRDVTAIAKRDGTPATGPLDPADLDGDGTITAHDATAAAARAAQQPKAAGYSIANVNAENYFDTVDNPRKRDQVLSPAEFAAKTEAIGALIATELGAPTLVAMEEVENATVLEALVQSPKLRRYGYDYRIVEGPDGRGINTALLFRASQGVRVEDVRTEQSVVSTKQADALSFATTKAGRNLFARPPLIVDLTIPNPRGKDEALTVVVNHFMSAYSPDGRPTEPWRVEQASFVRDLTARLRKERPEREVLVVGDLNANEQSPPMQLLGADTGPLRNVSERAVPRGERYSYVYKGSAEQLDHLFATDGVADRVAFARVHHVHADHPASASARPTDHDILQARIAFPTA